MILCKVSFFLARVEMNARKFTQIGLEGRGVFCGVPVS